MNPQHAYIFLTKRPERVDFQTDDENCMDEHYHATFEPLFEDVGDRQDERNKDYRKG